MTAYDLQLELAAEIERILKDVLLKDVEGNPAHIKAYAQCLPKRLQNISDVDGDQDGEIMPVIEPEGDQYPYCVVRADSGRMETAQGVHEIATVLVFGIFDDDFRCLGHQALMNMMHRVAERFIRNPVLNDRYTMNEETGIGWVLDDEDRYPYYFGAIEMSWDTFFAGREEDRYV